MLGTSTKKEEIIGNFKSGSSYSSKFSFIEHLNEETQIRIDNKQNMIFILIIYAVHYFKNLKKVNNNNKIKYFVNSFLNILNKNVIN